MASENIEKDPPNSKKKIYIYIYIYIDIFGEITILWNSAFKLIMQRKSEGSVRGPCAMYVLHLLCIRCLQFSPAIPQLKRNKEPCSVGSHTHTHTQNSVRMYISLLGPVHSPTIWHTYCIFNLLKPAVNTCTARFSIRNSAIFLWVKTSNLVFLYQIIHISVGAQ